MAPLPKRKISSHRQGRRRRTHRFKFTPPGHCPHCQHPKLPHFRCPHCGK